MKTKSLQRNRENDNFALKRIVIKSLERWVVVVFNSLGIGSILDYAAEDEGSEESHATKYSANNKL